MKKPVVKLTLDEAKQERELMLKFFEETGLGALQHWHSYTLWKKKHKVKA